jgi:hypothetical protein
VRSSHRPRCGAAAPAIRRRTAVARRGGTGGSATGGTGGSATGGTGGSATGGTGGSATGGTGGGSSSGGLTLSIDPSSIPEGHSGGGNYNVVITMAASGGNPPYSFGCSGSGLSGIQAIASGDKCTISGYAAATGFYDVVFSVLDAKGDGAEISSEILFCYDMTTSGRLPNYLKNESADIYGNNVPGATYYCFDTTEAYDIISVNQEAKIDSSGDYSSQIDLYVRENSYVHCPLDGPQADGGNDTVLICRRDSSNKCIKGQHLISPGSKFLRLFVIMIRIMWRNTCFRGPDMHIDPASFTRRILRAALFGLSALHIGEQASLPPWTSESGCSGEFVRADCCVASLA